MLEQRGPPPEGFLGQEGRQGAERGVGTPSPPNPLLPMKPRDRLTTGWLESCPLALCEPGMDEGPIRAVVHLVQPAVLRLPQTGPTSGGTSLGGLTRSFQRTFFCPPGYFPPFAEGGQKSKKGPYPAYWRASGSPKHTPPLTGDSDLHRPHPLAPTASRGP